MGIELDVHNPFSFGFIYLTKNYLLFSLLKPFENTSKVCTSKVCTPKESERNKETNPDTTTQI